jgi:hypothetical protein
VQVLENYDDVLPKFETVQEFHDAFSTLAGRIHHFLEEPDLDHGIINVKLFIFSDLGRDNGLLGVSVVNALDDLAKSPLVYYSHYLIAVSELFANLCDIVTFFVRDLVLILSTNISDRINLFKNAKFYFFKFGELGSKFFERLLRTVPIKILSIQRGLRAAGLGLRRLAASLPHLVNCGGWRPKPSSEEFKDANLLLVFLLWLKVGALFKIDTLWRLSLWDLTIQLSHAMIIRGMPYIHFSPCVFTKISLFTIIQGKI